MADGWLVEYSWLVGWLTNANPAIVAEASDGGGECKSERERERVCAYVCAYERERETTNNKKTMKTKETKNFGLTLVMCCMVMCVSTSCANIIYTPN